MDVLRECVDTFSDTISTLKINFLVLMVSFSGQIVAFSAREWVALSLNGTDTGEEGLWEHCDENSTYSCCVSLDSYLYNINGKVPSWVHASRAFQIIGLMLGCTTLVITILCTFIRKTCKIIQLYIAGYVLNILTAASISFSVVIYGSRYKQEKWLENAVLSESFMVTVIVMSAYIFNGLLMIIATHKQKENLQPMHTSQDLVTHDNPENTVNCTNKNLQPMHTSQDLVTHDNPENTVNCTNISINIIVPAPAPSNQIQVAPANQANTVVTTNAPLQGVPGHWDDMGNSNTEVVPLCSSSEEYKHVESAFNMSLGSTNVHIISIERIQIKSLYTQYIAQREKMKQALKTMKMSQIEKALWHGTSETTVESIVTYGFNRSYCGKNATLYGAGVYFARDSSFSARILFSPPGANRHRKMFRCGVLVGEYTQGDSSMKVPPVKSGHILYDSTVNDTGNPEIFVVYNDTQAYPKHLITFM